MQDFPRKMSKQIRRSLFDDGTDMSLETLENWNAFDAKLNPPRPNILDRLLDEPKPFHETTMPEPGDQPHQVAPPPPPPPPQRLRSVLKR